MTEPKLIEGGLSVDDRGTVSYVNDFNFKDVKRFYMVQNHSKGFIRAFHGHRREAKYVHVVSGTILLGIVSLDNAADASVYILSASQPKILFIPPGYYNGFKTLTEDAKIIFYSTATLEESKEDDIRRPWDTWNIWEEKQR
jgi:dTDP-4-dehydrorhamnose 3,5-epimerase